MLPAGQKYRLYWTEVNNKPMDLIYHELERDRIPRFNNSGWFNTDVNMIHNVLKNATVYNCRRLKPLEFAKYLNRKYQHELDDVLEHPHNSKERRFKDTFYNEWQLSSVDPKRVQQIIKMFTAYLLIRNLVSSVPKGCRKLFRKLVPLRIDDLRYDLKLLDYKFNLSRVIRFKRRINSLSDKPFGTAEFTNRYLMKHVPFLQIFNTKALKVNFNL